MPLFSRFKSKGGQAASKNKNQAAGNGVPSEPSKPRWQASWNSNVIEPEEIEELVHVCTAEMKSRAEALDAPFLLLPFRPNSNSSSARTLVRNFYKSNAEGADQFRGAKLQQELRLTESIVLCSVMKWCWARMPGGVVTWPVYEGFKIGEQEANMARNAFDTFVPISADSVARKNIIFDFFDLLAAVAAHGKMNGLGGRKLSRLAGWWAFEHSDDGKGFEGGYRSWEAAADASSHLFFAYLRSLSPDVEPSMNVIERIPRSLQALLASTEYPPETPTLLQRSTPRVVMVVENVSPTPFALLRRAKHFEYRDDDKVLREYQEFEDPLDALTEENKRVLYAISSTNSSAALSRHGNLIKPQESWSAFQNMGFSDMDEKSLQSPTGTSGSPRPAGSGLRSEPRSRNADYGRPTTPSWADFLSSGFQEDEAKTPTTLILPPDQILPPIGNRHNSQLMNMGDEDLAPGELAAIKNVELDDAFWWVWMTSLAGEEPAERKAVFGRCALVETTIMNGRWLIMEEQVKGATPDPAAGAYIAPKRSFFSFTKRGRLGRKRSIGKKLTSPQDQLRAISATPSKTSLAPDQHNKIKAAAAALARKQTDKDDDAAHRRGRTDESATQKTSSMLTVGMLNEASPAMKWASAYDKNAVRAQYLGDSFAGRGASGEDLVKQFPSSKLNGEPSIPAARPEPNVANTPSQATAPVPAVSESPPTAADPADALADAEPAESEIAEPIVDDSTLTAVLPSPALESKRASAPITATDPDDSEGEGAPVANIARTPIDKELGITQPGSPRSIGRKAVPRTNHPAFREPNGEEQAAPGPNIARKPVTPVASAAAIAAARAMEAKNTSPELQHSSKLKKQQPSSSGGLRNLFSRSKANRKSMDVQRPANGLAPPAESSVSRRLSLIRNKPSKPASERYAAYEPEVAATTPATTEPPVMAEPTMPNPPGSHYADSVTDASIQDADAEHEFARFDQGPMEDMPAFAPDHEDVPARSANSKHHFNTDLASRIAPEPTHDSFVAPPDAHVDNEDAQSEATMDDDTKQESNRWAAIRENAAKQAVRQSEEQSRPAESIKTDDGETSGEETIESRVARIKARVAELTGGIDSGNGARR